jgi:threonine synthase
MDPFPWDGDAALKAIDDSKGTAIAVSNDEILAAQRVLAKTEGIFAEPSGVTSLAGLVRMADAGRIERADTIVVEITGSGLKDSQITMRASPDVPLINPSIKELESILIA